MDKIITPPPTQTKGAEYDIWNNVMRKKLSDTGQVCGALKSYFMTDGTKYYEIIIPSASTITLLLEGTIYYSSGFSKIYVNAIKWNTQSEITITPSCFGTANVTFYRYSGDRFFIKPDTEDTSMMSIDRLITLTKNDMLGVSLGMSTLPSSAVKVNPVSMFADMERKTEGMLNIRNIMNQKGWYLLYSFTNCYTDAIIMLHKGFNGSVSNGLIVSYSNQHNQSDSDKSKSFNILNHSGSGAFKEIANVTYDGLTYMAVRYEPSGTLNEDVKCFVLANSLARINIASKDFQYIGENPENFKINLSKIL